MNLFKKKFKAFDFGKVLYLMIIDLLSNEGSPVELKKLISSMKLEKDNLSNNHEIETIVLLAYQTFVIIHNNFEDKLTYLILKGVKHRFISHYIEMGMSESESEFLRDLFEERFKQYNEAEKFKSHETIEEWAIIFLQKFLSDGRSFLNAFLWLRVGQFIADGTELMSKYIELFLNKHKIVN